MDGVRLPGESDISDEIGGWAGVNQARARGAFRVMGQQQESTLLDQRSEALWPEQGGPGVGWGPGRWVTGQERLGQIQEASESMQEPAGTCRLSVPCV